MMKQLALFTFVRVTNGIALRAPSGDKGGDKGKKPTWRRPREEDRDGRVPDRDDRDERRRDPVTPTRGSDSASWRLTRDADRDDRDEPWHYPVTPTRGSGSSWSDTSRWSEQSPGATGGFWPAYSGQQSRSGSRSSYAQQSPGEGYSRHHRSTGSHSSSSYAQQSPRADYSGEQSSTPNARRSIWGPSVPSEDSSDYDRFLDDSGYSGRGSSDTSRRGSLSSRSITETELSSDQIVIYVDHIRFFLTDVFTDDRRAKICNLQKDKIRRELCLMRTGMAVLLGYLETDPDLDSVVYGDTLEEVSSSITNRDIVSQWTYGTMSGGSNGGRLYGAFIADKTDEALCNKLNNLEFKLGKIHTFTVGEATTLEDSMMLNYDNWRCKQMETYHGVEDCLVMVSRVIPVYTDGENNIFIFVGKDNFESKRRHDKWKGFGGHVDHVDDNNAFAAAKREWDEEVTAFKWDTAFTSSNEAAVLHTVIHKHPRTKDAIQTFFMQAKKNFYEATKGKYEFDTRNCVMWYSSVDEKKAFHSNAKHWLEITEAKWIKVEDNNTWMNELSKIYTQEDLNEVKKKLNLY